MYKKLSVILSVGLLTLALPGRADAVNQLVAGTWIIDECDQAPVTNAGNTANSTKINVPGLGVELACDLVELPSGAGKNNGIDIVAKSLLLTANHSITANGTKGISILADVNSGSNKDCLAPLGGGVTFDSNTSVVATDSNGSVVVDSCGSIRVGPNSTVSSGHQNVQMTCYDEGPPACTIEFTTSTIPSAKAIKLTAVGDIVLTCSKFFTQSNIDSMTFISLSGSVIAASALPLANGNVCALCECSDEFRGGIESTMKIQAFNDVDLSGACIQIAEGIDITAGCVTQPNGNCVPGGTGDVNLANTELRNDFGKTGDITIVATPLAVPIAHGVVDTITGSGTINIDNAIIVDEGKKGGGPNPAKVANMNGTQVTLPGACNVVGATCSGAINSAENPVHADPTHRGQHNVTNATTVRCDS